MATLKELRDERLRKLEELKQLGINAYPAHAEHTNALADITEKFARLENQQVSVVGRIVNIRKFGKIAFVVIRDMSGLLQLFMAADKVAPLQALDSQLGFDQLPLLDAGDFIEAHGLVVKTKTGEISVDVQRLRLLTKSLRPLPTTHDGFTNKEERLRRRYVDMNVNQGVRDRFIRRSTFWQATRQYLIDHGFIEINVPVLEHTAGGADANPFVTHMDALDQDFYLRISHELPLKRLLGAGYEKVFDIGPRFRNENYSDEHLPEHVAMEWYWAYADWEQGIQFTQAMIRAIVDATWSRRQFTLANGQVIDFGADGADWPRVSFVQVIRERYGLDVFTCTLEEAVAQLKKIGGEVEKIDNRSRVLDKLWKKIRVELAGPAFLVDIPAFLQPLAKLQPDDARLTQQFNLLLGGTEACKAYSELNDPIDQLGRFVEQQQMRDAGDDEAMMLDIDFVEMLEYGMPPACGYGHSERLFWMLEGVTAREGVVFPQLRRDIDETTKSIYPEIKFETQQPTKVNSSQELPLSAVEQGTRKLYLDDYALRECDAKIVSTESQDEDNYRLVLDQSCFYPGGGGQDFDLGTINWPGGRLLVTEVSKGKEGVIYHDGVLEGDAPATGAQVHCKLDLDRRFLNSRLHCAGHLIDYAVQQIGKTWKPGRGAHYPDMSFVEYDGDFDAGEAESIACQIEAQLQALVAKGGAIGVKRVPSDEARKYSAYIPERILGQYQQVHLAVYPNNFYICCGGTHLADVSQLGKVTITKIKKKDGRIRVSYALAS